MSERPTPTPPKPKTENPSKPDLSLEPKNKFNSLWEFWSLVNIRLGTGFVSLVSVVSVWDCHTFFSSSVFIIRPRGGLVPGGLALCFSSDVTMGCGAVAMKTNSKHCLTGCSKHGRLYTGLACIHEPQTTTILDLSFFIKFVFVAIIHFS